MNLGSDTSLSKTYLHLLSSIRVWVIMEILWKLSEIIPGGGEEKKAKAVWSIYCLSCQVF